MQQFLAGIIIALAAVVPIFFYLIRKFSKKNTGKYQHLEQLEELSKFTGELAHEIKNPLSTIKVNLQLINEGLEDLNKAHGKSALSSSNGHSLARALRKINVIQKETNRLEQILNGFMQYLDRSKLRLTNLNVNELVNDMADFYSPQAHSNSITIRLGLCKEPLVCKIDEDMLKQVLLNLFINAQQAMKDGGELMIRTYLDAQNAVIRISDTGSGIEPEKLGHIFDFYYSSSPQGSGFGLPTAKKIVERHNGTMNVESEPGKGTSFAIELPVLEK
ncbi:MAG: sensor histidine kinase [Planctomycetota bacterium]